MRSSLSLSRFAAANSDSVDLSPDSSYCTHLNQHFSNDQMASFIQIEIPDFLQFSDDIDALQLLELAVQFGNHSRVDLDYFEIGPGIRYFL